MNPDGGMATHALVAVLQRLPSLIGSRPEVAAELLDFLKRRDPDLHRQAVLHALHLGEIATDDAASALGLDIPAMRSALADLRSSEPPSTEGEIAVDPQGIARIQGTIVAVWELVWRFRQSGTVEALTAAFPALTEAQVRAGLAYAGLHPEEIARQILAYESHRRQVGLAVVEMPIPDQG
ncbi:MAG: DUF433 domain-containing protein [Fimbriimonadaceae bacterium]|nr:DUF433 domain-containing protein [Fimbriimonadaceae bacterium]